VAKNAHIGIGEVARKTKKIYAGIDGVARTVKKGYVGIAGVARQWWPSEEPLAGFEPLATGRHNLAATTVGNYALFGGGRSFFASDGNSSVVDAYDTSLIRSTPTPLAGGRFWHAATTVGNYALFSGGQNGTGNYKTLTDAYDTALVRSTPDPASTYREYGASTTVGNYGLFGGMELTNGYVPTQGPDAYSTSLVRSNAAPLSRYVYQFAATTVGNYALFGGGYGTIPDYELSTTRDGNIDTVNAYNNFLTRSNPTSLSVGRRRLAATAVGNHALFGGGFGGAAFEHLAVVDAYDTSLTRSTPMPLSVGSSDLSATTVGNYAVFGGGSVSFIYDHLIDADQLRNVVDAYDASLTRSTLASFSVARTRMAATTVGDYALFGGGITSTGVVSHASAAVDAYDSSLTHRNSTTL
jgi:hypothetical protein